MAIDAIETRGHAYPIPGFTPYLHYPRRYPSSPQFRVHSNNLAGTAVDLRVPATVQSQAPSVGNLVREIHRAEKMGIGRRGRPKPELIDFFGRLTNELSKYREADTVRAAFKRIMGDTALQELMGINNLAESVHNLAMKYLDPDTRLLNRMYPSRERFPHPKMQQGQHIRNLQLANELYDRYVPAGNEASRDALQGIGPIKFTDRAVRVAGSLAVTVLAATHVQDLAQLATINNLPNFMQLPIAKAFVASLLVNPQFALILAGGGLMVFGLWRWLRQSRRDKTISHFFLKIAEHKLKVAVSDWKQAYTMVHRV